MSSASAATQLVLPITGRDHVSGPAAAPATLLEYADYQCPYCGRAHEVVKALRQHLGKRLQFCMRHFPLSTVHPRAAAAAEAAEAAGAQGKFWEMHDLLFEHQDELEDEDLIEYADALHLDLERFTSELATHVHAPRVREDFVSGVSSGVNGTPTFCINGVRHDGA